MVIFYFARNWLNESNGAAHSNAGPYWMRPFSLLMLNLPLRGNMLALQDDDD